MKKDVMIVSVIVMLSLIIIALVGFIFLSEEDKTNIESKISKAETEEDCIALLRDSISGAENCRETGIVKLYGYTDEENCALDDALPICRGARWINDVELFEKCKESFGDPVTIFTDCLASLE